MDRLGHLRALPDSVEKRIGVKDQPQVSPKPKPVQFRPASPTVREVGPLPFGKQIYASGSEVFVSLAINGDYDNPLDIWLPPDQAEAFAMDLANAAAQARMNADRAAIPTAAEVQRSTAAGPTR